MSNKKISFLKLIQFQFRFQILMKKTIDVTRPSLKDVYDDNKIKKYWGVKKNKRRKKTKRNFLSLILTVFTKSKEETDFFLSKFCWERESFCSKFFLLKNCFKKKEKKICKLWPSEPSASNSQPCNYKDDANNNLWLVLLLLSVFISIFSKVNNGFKRI